MAVGDRTQSAETVHPTATSPADTINATGTCPNAFVMVSLQPAPGLAAGTPVCANAGWQGEDRRKCSGNRRGGAGSAVADVPYCAHRKGLGHTVTRADHRVAAGVGRRRRRRARTADAARGGGAAAPGACVHAPRAAR